MLKDFKDKKNIITSIIIILKLFIFYTSHQNLILLIKTSSTLYLGYYLLR